MRTLFVNNKTYIVAICTLLCAASMFLLPAEALAAWPDFDFEGPVDKLINTIKSLPAVLSFMLLGLFQLILWISGMLLNFVIQFTVIGMKAHINETGITAAWSVVRDVANMSFIFILLYSAIRTIVGVGKDMRGTIVKVIMVAILINFSLFLTKVVIDASNVLAITFYDAIAPGATAEGVNGGVANAIMDRLGLQTITLDFSEGGLRDDVDHTKVIVISIMGSIFVSIAAFIFFAISIMFVVRFVVLIFVMVLSPIAFLAFALPELRSKADEWKDALFNQAFFAPVYFLLMWVVLRLMDGMFETEGGAFAAAFLGGRDPTTGLTQSPNDIEIILNFVIIIAFLVASVVIAKQISNKSGQLVSRAHKWASGVASVPGGLAARAVAYYPQRGLARLDERIGESKLAYTAVGSVLRSGTTGALAGVKIGGKTALDTKKEFEQRRERKTIIDKEEQAIGLVQETAGLSDKARSLREDAKKSRAEAEKLRGEGKIDDARIAENAAEAYIKVADAHERKVSEAQRAMMRISPKAFTSLAKNRYFDPEFMRNATSAQFEALVKSGRLTEDEISRAVGARVKFMEDSLNEWEAGEKEYTDKLEEWRKEMDEFDEGKKIVVPGSDADKEIDKAIANLNKEKPKRGRPTAYEDIRNKSAKEYELINQYRPEFLFGEDEDDPNVFSMVRFDTMRTMRASDNLTQLEKDKVREFKFHDIIEMKDKLAGLEAELERTTDAAVIKTLERDIKWANRALDEAMAGKAENEIPTLPGAKGWKAPQIMRRLDSSHLPHFSTKDTGDKKLIPEFFIKELKAMINDPANKTVSRQNIKAIEWILNTNNGNKFYPESNDELKDLALKAKTDAGLKIKVEGRAT